ncbi:hypothetical protein HanIR_Chr06g0289831 [Helianthus annuus]|nr:hypothetical protein HanIR_Chr06g0289831 [Helianthus annuus]
MDQNVSKDATGLKIVRPNSSSDPSPSMGPVELISENDGDGSGNLSTSPTKEQIGPADKAMAQKKVTFAETTKQGINNNLSSRVVKFRQFETCIQFNGVLISSCANLCFCAT